MENNLGTSFDLIYATSLEIMDRVLRSFKRRMHRIKLLTPVRVRYYDILWWFPSLHMQPEAPTTCRQPWFPPFGDVRNVNWNTSLAMSRGTVSLARKVAAASRTCFCQMATGKFRTRLLNPRKFTTQSCFWLQIAILGVTVVSDFETPEWIYWTASAKNRPDIEITNTLFPATF